MKAKQSSEILRRPRRAGVSLAETQKLTPTKPLRRRAPRLPGDAGSVKRTDRPSETKAHRSTKRRFPLTPEAVIAKCQQQERPLECAGEVLALMQLMTLRGCSMHHLHVISQVGYATVHDFLDLETFPATEIRVRMIRPLSCDIVEFELIAVLSLRERGL